MQTQPRRYKLLLPERQPTIAEWPVVPRLPAGSFRKLAGSFRKLAGSFRRPHMQ